MPALVASLALLFLCLLPFFFSVLYGLSFCVQHHLISCDCNTLRLFSILSSRFYLNGWIQKTVISRVLAPHTKGERCHTRTEQEKGNLLRWERSHEDAEEACSNSRYPVFASLSFIFYLIFSPFSCVHYLYTL